MSAKIVLQPTGNFSVPVSLSCSNLPVGVNCSFTQPVVTPGTAQVTTQLTLQANSTTASLIGTHSTFALWFPGLSFGMFVLGDRKRSRKFWLTAGLIAIFVMALLCTGCGGGSMKSSSTTGSTPTSTPASKPGTYQVSIVAQAGSFQRTTTATVIVQ